MSIADKGTVGLIPVTRIGRTTNSGQNPRMGFELRKKGKYEGCRKVHKEDKRGPRRG